MTPNIIRFEKYYLRNITIIDENCKYMQVITNKNFENIWLAYQISTCIIETSISKIFPLGGFGKSRIE